MVCLSVDPYNDTDIICASLESSGGGMVMQWLALLNGIDNGWMDGWRAVERKRKCTLWLNLE